MDGGEGSSQDRILQGPLVGMGREGSYPNSFSPSMNYWSFQMVKTERKGVTGSVVKKSSVSKWTTE